MESIFEDVCAFVLSTNSEFDIIPFRWLHWLLICGAEDKSKDFDYCYIAIQKVARVLQIGTKEDVNRAQILLQCIKNEPLNKKGLQQWAYMVKVGCKTSSSRMWNDFIPLSLQSMYKVSKHTANALSNP